MAMGGTIDFKGFLRAIGNRDHDAVLALLTEAPRLATASLIRRDEFFLTERFAQVYQGDTALHAAGFSYDSEMARALVALGADIRARNRRGAEPLHAAVIGNPASPTWNPADQRDVIMFLIECGADPNATAAGGVTPLHRAVRNRCSSAVETLLRAGADPHLLNESGSTARDLATLTTGRGGSGSAEAKAEQRIILELLETSAL
jgi:ankyrin repeat protein